METLTITTIRGSRRRRLSAEHKCRLAAYFMRRYPEIRKITIGTRPDRSYSMRAKYNDGRNRTVAVSAYTYESLVIAMGTALSVRGLE